MSENVEEMGILVGLDEWFDTRLATVVLLEKEKAIPEGTAAAFLTTGYWSQRTDDHVPLENASLFAQAYARRNRDTLIYAVPTLAREAVMELIRINYDRYTHSPVVGRPVLYFNTWPYTELVDEEIINIQKGLIASTNRMVEVRMVKMSPAELSCEWLRDRISVFLCYHYTEWLSANLEVSLLDIKKPTAAKVGMVAPGISQGEAFRDRRELGVCLNDIAEMTRPVIGIDFAPVQNFSVPVLPKTN